MPPASACANSADAPAPLVWDVGIPQFSRYMIGSMAKAMLGGAVLAAALIGLLLGAQGEWDAVLPVATMLLGIGFGLFLLALLVMAVVFRGRMATCFTLDSKGARMQLVDRTARAGNRLAFWGGLVSGKPGAAGAGALASSQEDQWFGWNGTFTATFEPATHSISLRNGWRTLVRIYCLPGNYQQAVALVERGMRDHATAACASSRSPLWGYLLRTLLVVVSSLPLFALTSEFDLSLFMPLLVLCFGLATVWFVRPLAWVVLGSLVIIIVQVVSQLMEQHRSMFTGAPYRRYDVMSGDDWALIAIARLVGAMLVWGAMATLRGRITPALTQDWSDTGND